MDRDALTPVLVTTIARKACVVPVVHVVETMRPQSTDSGTIMHRGETVRVIDGAALAKGERVEPTRCIVLRTQTGRIALLVDDVIAVRRITSNELGPAVLDSDIAVLREVRVLREDQR